MSPAVEIEGVLIASMVTGGVETILGVRHDPTFGPVVMFGFGGTLVGAIEDFSFHVAPFGEAKAGRRSRRPGQPRCCTARAARPVRRGRSRGGHWHACPPSRRHGDRIDSAEIDPFVVLPEGHDAVALDAVIVASGLKNPTGQGA